MQQEINDNSGNLAFNCYILTCQVDQFWRDGYLVYGPLLTPEDCDLLLSEVGAAIKSRSMINISSSRWTLPQVSSIQGGRHPGHQMLYEFHRYLPSCQPPPHLPSNQTGQPDQVLMHSLGHWRLAPGLHDLVFLPSLGSAASRLLVQGRKVIFSISPVLHLPLLHSFRPGWSTFLA